MLVWLQALVYKGRIDEPTIQEPGKEAVISGKTLGFGHDLSQRMNSPPVDPIRLPGKHQPQHWS